MTRSPTRLGSPLAYAAVGASLLAIPATAVALVSPNENGSNPRIKTRIKRRQIEYGGPVVVVGNAPASDDGQMVALQFFSPGRRGWHEVASAPISSRGRFRLVAWLNRSGWLMAAMAKPGGAVTGDGSFATTSSTSSSTPEHVAVAAAVRVRRRAINELSARSIVVRGSLLPDAPGRKVQLQDAWSGHWVTLAWGRTNSRGAFRLHLRPDGPGEHRLRVRFEGDKANAASSSNAGSLTLYEPTVASWYYDAGTTACGFHAYYGVANLNLPCGTSVRFFYGGRTVHAVVDDRGPYVGGRTWDLNENTAAALGFAGVATVWSSR